MLILNAFLWVYLVQRIETQKYAYVVATSFMFCE